MYSWENERLLLIALVSSAVDPVRYVLRFSNRECRRKSKLKFYAYVKFPCCFVTVQFVGLIDSERQKGREEIEVLICPLI
jgi:hypothetical protein